MTLKTIKFVFCFFFPDPGYSLGFGAGGGGGHIGGVCQQVFALCGQS